VPHVRHAGHRLESIPFEQALAFPSDCAIICTDHTAFDYPQIAARAALTVDTRNALKGIDSPTVVRI
jgi:UDP-N-acetyl-D-glucosamine dehydrogenase